MYDQGSHGSMPQFQQRPIAPLPPPPQLTLSSSQSSSMLQGHPPIPQNVSYSGSFVYQHTPSHPMPPVQVPTSGMLNSGLPYLPPPPPLPQPVPGSISVPNLYPTAQQPSQWTHNPHHILRSLPPIGPSFAGSSPPEMFPPSYRGPIHLPPPPSTFSFFTPVPFGSFAHSVHQDSNEPNVGSMPPMPPLPLPPPPPPLSPPPSSPPLPPPSPPLPTSPAPLFGTLSSTPLVVTASDSSHNSGSGPISNLAGSENPASASVDKVAVTTQLIVDGFQYDGDKNPEGSTRYEAGPLAVLAEEDLYNVEGTKLDLPSLPPKPSEEKVMKIVDLCHVIASNDSSFEGIVRQGESGNPECKFLFGVQPGSEAAISREYFECMENKCNLARNLIHKERSSALTLPDNASTKTCTLTEAGLSHSNSDSDMDMEDDFSQPNEEQQLYNSSEGLNSEAVTIPKELPDKLRSPQNAIERSLAKDAIRGSSGLPDRGKGSKHFPVHDHFTKIPKAEFCNRPLQDSSECKALAVSSEEFSDELIKSLSPFRLIQDYASDDTSEDDVKRCLENLSSVDMVFEMSSESGVPCSLSMPSNALDFFPESPRSCTEANITATAAVKTEKPTENNYKSQESIENAVYPEALKPNDPLDEIRYGAPESVKAVRQKEDDKYASSLPKIGRLVREGASDCDSDEWYTGRRGKRRRSRSESRSSHDRIKNPLRRKEKRCRFHSWSPKKQRRRSKSPTYNHHDSFKTDVRIDYRIKQHVEVPPVSGISDCFEENAESLDREKVLVSVQQSVQEDELLDIDVSKSERSAEVVTAVMHENQDIKEEILEPTTEILDKKKFAEIVDTVHPVGGFPSSLGLTSSQEYPGIPQSQTNPSLSVFQNAFQQPLDVDGSFMSGSSSSALQNQSPVITSSTSQPFVCGSSSFQTLPHKEHGPPISPSIPFLSQGTIRLSPPQSPGEVSPPNQVLLQNQRSCFASPPKSWPLPPPPPLPPLPNSTVGSLIATQSSHCSQFQQNQLPSSHSLHPGDFKLNPYPMVNSTSQPFGGFSFAQGNSTSFQNYPHLQQQRTLHGRQQPGAESLTVNLGDYRNADRVDRNQLPNLSDFVVSRISNHYNPYASTFDHPPTSKFCSNLLKRENDTPQLFDGPYSLSRVTVDGPGNQYDPFFDSIEPSSNSSKKFDFGLRRGTMLSRSESYKPLDVEENKRKEVEPVAVTTSIKSENDECGETEDAEVGDVDNASASNPLDEGNAIVGEIEIDQVKTAGKKVKDKDSRSMAHFKVAIANFVKEELKPSWRQGNLSKEAFKIIVKKIVDKVSGSMKSHHVPKSQSKINHYINSSQRKLSKLVTGYLSKYAKG